MVHDEGNLDVEWVPSVGWLSSAGWGHDIGVGETDAVGLGCDEGGHDGAAEPWFGVVGHEAAECGHGLHGDQIELEVEGELENTARTQFNPR